MECRAVDKLMDAWFDRELQPASAVELQAHLASCARCQQNWGGLVALLTDPLPVEVPLGLRDRILARVVEEHPGHPARYPKQTGRLVGWMRWHKYAGAMAACLTFFVTGWLVSGWWRTAPVPNIGNPQPAQTVVMSPWMMSSLAQAAAMPGPISPAVLLALGVVPELMIASASMTEPAIRVRSRTTDRPATQPADSVMPPELHMLPIVPRIIGA